MLLIFSCGKLFHSDVDVQAHAARTKHTNFSESTEVIRPLTEEERKAQLAKLVASYVLSYASLAWPSLSLGWRSDER